MKFSLSASLLALAPVVRAQAPQNQTGPFFLHITGIDNKTIDGYGSACHAGAAIEGLCFDNGPTPSGNVNSASFYFNYTGNQDVDGAEVGFLSWNLQLAGGGSSEPTVVPSPMSFTFAPTSNVAQPMFGTSNVGQQVGFDKDGKLFVYGLLDDSTFQPGSRPDAAQPKAYYSWFACWQSFTSYYYPSVGWATTVPPHNPTCQAVDITQVMV